MDINVSSWGQGVEETKDPCHWGSSSGSLGFSHLAFLYIPALSLSGSSMTTLTGAIPSWTPSPSIKQRKNSALLSVPGERAPPSPNIPGCSGNSAQTGLGQVAPLNQGDSTSVSVWKSPHLHCCPSVILSSAPFHSQKHSSLDDKAYGHPFLNTHCAREAERGFTGAVPTPSPGIWPGKDFPEQNQDRYQKRRWKLELDSKTQRCAP